jgi:chorismate synthase
VAGNSFGRCFRITTAGESHGPGNVVIVDGCPAGLELTEEDLRVELRRRRPGQSHVVSQRMEEDEPEILSGLFEGKTTGAPIAVLVRNSDAKSQDYDAIRDKYRPGHADFVWDAKFGLRDHRGGGRASARETVARVAAGAIAKKLLDRALGVRVLGWVVQVGDVRASVPDPTAVALEAVEATPVRCPDPVAAARMLELIEAVRKAQDSIGGVAEVVAVGVPAGLGEPVFDKLKAELAKALFSIPAVVGVELGSGFSAAEARGSEHNDVFVTRGGRTLTETNRHGGILGGISTGMPILLRAAVKPTSSLPQEQPTVDRAGAPTTVRTLGRHDPCLLPRFVPVAEAMVALTLADHLLRHRARASSP